MDFRRTDKAANKEDLNRIVTATKVTDGKFVADASNMHVKSLINNFMTVFQSNCYDNGRCVSQNKLTDGILLAVGFMSLPTTGQLTPYCR